MLCMTFDPVIGTNHKLSDYT